MFKYLSTFGELQPAHSTCTNLYYFSFNHLSEGYQPQTLLNIAIFREKSHKFTGIHLLKVCFHQ